MHAAAYTFLSEQTARFKDRRVRVLEFGARNVNGSARTVDGLNCATYCGVDLFTGDGVNIQADAATDDLFVRYNMDERWDIVICAEVFEHERRWRTIVKNAARCLAPDGMLLVTAATDPRHPHSWFDGHDLTDAEQAGEWPEYYRNVTEEELRDAFERAGFTEYATETHPQGDLYGFAVKGR